MRTPHLTGSRVGGYAMEIQEYDPTIEWVPEWTLMRFPRSFVTVVRTPYGLCALDSRLLSKRWPHNQINEN